MTCGFEEREAIRDGHGDVVGCNEDLADEMRCDACPAILVCPLHREDRRGPEREDF